MEHTVPDPVAEPSPSQLVEEVWKSFLYARSKTLSSRIVDLADDSRANTIREQAAPGQQGRPLRETIDDMLQVMSHRVAMEHPKFFGFIPSPVHESSLLGQLITTMFNVHAGSWYQSSGPSAIEDALIEWLARQVRLPASAGGVFLSGGSMANLTAVVAARDAKLSFEQRGIAVIYLSDQTHSSVLKGLKIAGFHESQIRRVECDSLLRMKSSSLRKAIFTDKCSGLLPFLIVATCGLTNTGGIDPLDELADVAEEAGLWLHVDGAYGASVALSRDHQQLADGLGRADSLSWDAHKWLFQTYGCGVVLVRDARNLTQSFATDASYIRDANETNSHNINFWNRGIELTRPVRAMKLWFTLQILGTEKIGELIDHGIRLAETAEHAFRDLEDWEIVTPAQLGIVNFRYLPSSHREAQGSSNNDQPWEKINLEISRRAILRNLAAPLTTVLYGRLALRMCTISPMLETHQLLQIVQDLNALAKEIVAEDRQQ